MLPGNTRFFKQHGFQQVRQGARAGGCCIGQLGVGTHPVHQISHTRHAVWHGGANGQAKDHFSGQRHGLQVGNGVVGQLGVKVGVDGRNRALSQQHGGAVGRRTLQRVDRNLACRTRAVVHNRTTRVAGGQLLCNPARHDVGDAASRAAAQNAQLLNGGLRLGAKACSKSKPRTHTHTQTQSAELRSNGRRAPDDVTP